MIRMERSPSTLSSLQRKAEAGHPQRHQAQNGDRLHAREEWSGTGWWCLQQGHGGTMMREAGKRLSPDYKSLSTGTLVCPSQYLPVLDLRNYLNRCKVSNSLVLRTGPDLLRNLQYASVMCAFFPLKASLLGHVLLSWGVVR